jgi:hypothetical protein
MGITLTDREAEVYDLLNAGTTADDALAALDGVNSKSRLNGLASSVRSKMGNADLKWVGSRSGNGGTVTETKTPDAPEVVVDEFAIADEIKPPYGRIWVQERNRLNDSAPTDSAVKVAERNLQAAQDRLAEEQTRYTDAQTRHAEQVETFMAAAKDEGFDFDVFEEKVAEAIAEANKPDEGESTDQS